MTSDLLGQLRERKVSLMDKIVLEPKSQQVRKISEMIDKHIEFEKTMTGLVSNQTERQEEQFNKRINERRERSVSRSLNKTSDNTKSKERIIKKEVEMEGEEEHQIILKHPWTHRRPSAINQKDVIAATITNKSKGDGNVFKSSEM